MDSFDGHSIVGISSTKGPEDFLYKYKFVKSSGATPLLLPPAHKKKDLDSYFNQCQPNVLWLDDQVYHYSKENLIQFNEASTLFFTSGSSSFPKVVVHSDSNLEISAKESLSALNVAKSVPIMTPLPLWHVGGLLCYYRSLFLGSELILTHNKTMMRDLELHKNSLVVLVPAQLESLLDNNLDKSDLSQHIFYLGGGAVNLSLKEKIQVSNITALASYGMTETAGAVATGITNLKAMKETSIKIDSSGRLSVKTKRNAQNYIINNKLEEISHKDHYIETSDLAVLCDNYFSITGRIDQVFISGGENISPFFLEELIKGIDPEIKGVKVIAKSHERLENEIIVFISPYTHALKESITEKLPHTFRPHKILSWPQHGGIKPALKDFQDKAESGE